MSLIDQSRCAGSTGCRCSSIEAGVPYHVFFYELEHSCAGPGYVRQKLGKVSPKLNFEIVSAAFPTHSIWRRKYEMGYGQWAHRVLSDIIAMRMCHEPMLLRIRKINFTERLDMTHSAVSGLANNSNGFGRILISILRSMPATVDMTQFDANLINSSIVVYEIKRSIYNLQPATCVC